MRKMHKYVHWLPPKNTSQSIAGLHVFELNYGTEIVLKTTVIYNNKYVYLPFCVDWIRSNETRNF